MNRMMIATLVLLTFTKISNAHEFWIEPESHHAEPGKILRMSLKYGERFLGETLVRDESQIEKFALIGSDGERRVVGRSGKPVSFARTGTPGLNILTYRSRRRFNEMGPRQFETYLYEEGLEEIVHRRKSLGETDKPGREVFSRCAKALVLVGDVGDEGHDRVIGLPLEIIPEANPFLLHAGAELPLRVVFRGEPLRDTRVVFVNKDRPRELMSACTDTDGLVKLVLPDEGSWMATTLHMTRAPADVDADWESFWASLTFEIPRDRRRADATTTQR